MQYLFVGLGGMLGAMLRVAVQSLRIVPLQAWHSTMIINLAGSFAIGCLWLVLTHYNAPAWCSRLLVAGLLGGFTTFSSFSLDFIALVRDARWADAALYWSVSAVGGPLLCALAYWLMYKILNS